MQQQQQQQYVALKYWNPSQSEWKKDKAISIQNWMGERKKIETKNSPTKSNVRRFGEYFN